MFTGSVLAIHIASTKAAPLISLDEVRAVAGQGLEGDRYFKGEGFYSWFKGPIREVSLIESEVLEAVLRDQKLDMSAALSRRNLLTQGVPLGHLVGREFRVGAVLMRGVEICEPCEHLVALTGRMTAIKALLHRGGLHAQILSDGLIRVGDEITPAP